MTQNKNWLFARYFETVQHLKKKKKIPELWFLILHIFMVQIALQNSGGKVFFFWGGGTYGSKNTLVT